MTKDTGGSAFPNPEIRLDDGTGIREGSDGMTLRDYIAIAAMSGALGGTPGGHLHWAQLAKESYEHADAMIAERSKP